MTTVLILLGGGTAPDDLDSFDHIICADSGYDSLEGGKVEPDHLVGDMDSIRPDLLEKAKKTGVRITSFPQDKDLTDGEIAIRKALKLDPDRVVICGGRKGRLDHVLSGSNLLFLLPPGVRSEMRIDRDRIHLLREGDSIVLPRQEGILSILPARGDCTVSVEGMRWELDSERLTFGSTRGIHNEFLEEEAKVRSLSGDIFVMVVHEVH